MVQLRAVRNRKDVGDPRRCPVVHVCPVDRRTKVLLYLVIFIVIVISHLICDGIKVVPPVLAAFARLSLLDFAAKNIHKALFVLTFCHWMAQFSVLL